jgi:hypothetical protein
MEDLPQINKSYAIVFILGHIASIEGEKKMTLLDF